jgi:translation elongation factor P/translation initiation factor 5A
MFGQINANEMRNGKNNKILGKPFNFVETPTHRIGKEKSIHRLETL